MKKINLFFVLFLFVVMGCEDDNRPTNKSIIVDVTKNYPHKELILQDFLDVEYIPLETNDMFQTQGTVLAIGRDFIVVKNRINDGDIFFFDKTTGKGLKKINRKGQGPEEYVSAPWITLDEDAGEMFVNDISTERILVYDFDGTFKRSFKQREGSLYVHMYNFDKENLLCYDGFFDNENKGNMHLFLLISKQDGGVTKEIDIPFDKKIATTLIVKDGEMVYGSRPETHYPILSHWDSWIFVDPSSDTIYNYQSDHKVTPLIVRSPSVQSMDPEIFLFLSNLSDRYYFMEAVKKIYDFATDKGFPGVDLVYDMYENATYKYTIYNDDYILKRPISIKPIRPRPVCKDIVSWQLLESFELVEAYKKGELTGQLKEIAAKLDEESNPVIMMTKHKK